MAIHWYGERGIVNALVTNLDKSGIDAGKAFIKCIQWGADSDRSWVEQIVQIDYIVEIGLNSFGDPDLILVCKTSMNATYVVFIETKAKTFAASLEFDGYSRINRQLTFKYRFAVAQERWLGRDYEPIQEDETQGRAYHPPSESSSLMDSKLTLRKIAKQPVLSILKRTGLVGIPMDRIYFVAWTWDSEPYFSGPDFLQSDNRPLFLDASKKEVLEQLLPRLGWLSYRAIFNCNDLSFLHAALKLALKTMQEDDQPVVSESDPKVGGPSKLNYRAFFSDEKQQPIGQQYSRILEELTTRFTASAISEYETGLSLTLKIPGGGKKVVLKMVPSDSVETACLAIGVTTAVGDAKWAGEMRDVAMIGGKSPQPFYIIPLPPGMDGDKLAMQVIDELEAFVRKAD